jgi:transcriptional regulator with XRE-family HTH domain
MEEIKNRLKKIRQELRMNQSQFSQRLGITQSTYSGIESGREPLTERNMKLICLEFRVNMDWLQYGGDGPIFENQELSFQEKELLDLYEKLIPENQGEILRYITERLELQELRAAQAQGKKDDGKGETPGIGPQPKDGQIA